MTVFERIQNIKSQNKVYIIAEIGSNYKDYTDQVNAISLAKQMGADAIKFQYFNDSELYGPRPIIEDDHPFQRLKIKADRVGIDLIASSFSPEGLERINPFVCAHKIASCEMSHIRLIEAAKKTAKPIILSTGAYSVQDIKRVVDFVGDYPLILMHCNVSYPAKYVDIEKFRVIKSIYGGPVGFSDHTTNIDVVPESLKREGASVYEKHWNPYEFKDTADAPHSLTTDEFQCMVTHLRGVPSHFNEESVARLKHIRRIVSTRDIRLGESFIEGENIGIFRSRFSDPRGANPFSISEICKKKANKEIKAGLGVSFMDAE